MQVAIAPGLGELSGYFVAQQRGQSSGQPQQQRQIDAGVNTDFIAQIDQIFSADIARGTRRKRATAKAAEAANQAFCNMGGLDDFGSTESAG